MLTRKLSRHIRPVNVPTQFDYRRNYRKFFDFQAYFDESLAYFRQYLAFTASFLLKHTDICSNVLTRNLSRYIRPVNVPTQFDYRHDYRKFFDFQAYFDESLAYFRQYLAFTASFLLKHTDICSNVLTRNLSRHIRPVNVPTQFDYRHDYRSINLDKLT